MTRVVVVSDTSPIRALAGLGRLDVLAPLFGELWVPPAVEAELAQAGFALPHFLPAGLAVHVRPPADQRRVLGLLRELDPGESEALALAVELDAGLVLIDERRGRRVAERLGLKPQGVLQVLLDAKAAGLIPAVRPLVERLHAELDFHMSAGLITTILDAAGE